MDREQWAHLKDIIHHLYIDQNLNCKQVANILREQHDSRVRLTPPSNDRWLTTVQRTDATTTHERMGLRERLSFRISSYFNTLAKSRTGRFDYAEVLGK